jgi:hypothetical protein
MPDGSIKPADSYNCKACGDTACEVHEFIEDSWLNQGSGYWMYVLTATTHAHDNASTQCMLCLTSRCKRRNHFDLYWLHGLKVSDCLLTIHDWCKSTYFKLTADNVDREYTTLAKDHFAAYRVDDVFFCEQGGDMPPVVQKRVCVV